MDPTAPDIHLGHTVVLQKLRTFQDLGHTVVLIVGDYTARVGDPSGATDIRPVLSPEEIEANALTYQEQAFKVLDRERTEIRHNSEWLEMPSGQFFDLVRRFTVARLLERDDFQKRMEAEEGISTLELLYPVLQGYDSVAVEADIEMGGTDQRFNLLFGRDVQVAFGIRRRSRFSPCRSWWGPYGVRKMSKSYDNYVGVTDEPADMFGKLMSVPDDVMAEYYLLLSGPRARSGCAPQRGEAGAGARAGGAVPRRRRGGGRGGALRPVHKHGEVPDDIPEVALGADGETVHLPALLARGVRRVVERGAAADRAGWSAGRGRGPWRPMLLDVPADEPARRVLQLGKRRFVRLRGRRRSRASTSGALLHAAVRSSAGLEPTIASSAILSGRFRAVRRSCRVPVRAASGV